MFAVESLVQLVRLDRLWPEDVPLVHRSLVKTIGGVAVEDGAAESDVLRRVAVAANGHVPAGHHELKLLASRLAKDGDAVLIAEPAGVVAQLPIDPLVPLGLVEPFKNRADDGLLVGSIEVVIDVILGDVPVGAHAGAQ